jgi:hypothetical protein
MRITVDPVKGGPSHAVTVAEVREALRSVPPEWTAQIETVRISASMHSWEIASFSRVTSRLVLCTRGREKAAVLAALLRELFSNANQTHPIPDWRLSAKQKKTLDAKVDAQLSKVPSA